MIQTRHVVTLTLAGLCLVPLTTAFAQLGGSRAGVTPQQTAPGATAGMALLEPEVVQGYITIEGRAELRVAPTKIRVVLAVTAEAKGPAECKRLVAQKTAALVNAWTKMGIARDDIVEDFIAVLPRYDFEIEKVRNRDMAVEKRIGFVMQSNMHVAVRDDDQAMKVVDAAFEQDVSDIIAFDYWNEQLDNMKAQARTDAVKAARAKADSMLSVLFEKRPPIINVQESTHVIYPKSLYESFANVNQAQYQPSYSHGSMPEVRTFRPKNTYYRGLYPDADVQSRRLPMRSEISIVSTVRLYFESPAAERQNAKKEHK